MVLAAVTLWPALVPQPNSFGALAATYSSQAVHCAWTCNRCSFGRHAVFTFLPASLRVGGHLAHDRPHLSASSSDFYACPLDRQSPAKLVYCDCIGSRCFLSPTAILWCLIFSAPFAENGTRAVSAFSLLATVTVIVPSPSVAVAMSKTFNFVGSSCSEATGGEEIRSDDSDDK